MDIKPLNRSKWQAGLVFFISFLAASYYPRYSTTIYEATGGAVAFISARWLILWRAWINRGAPEKRKTDIAVRVGTIEKSMLSLNRDRHALREELNHILGGVQIDMRELKDDLKAIKYLLEIGK